MYGGKLQRKMRIVDDGDVVAGNYLEARELYQILLFLLIRIRMYFVLHGTPNPGQKYEAHVQSPASIKVPSREQRRVVNCASPGSRGNFWLTPLQRHVPSWAHWPGGLGRMSIPPLSPAPRLVHQTDRVPAQSAS
jgi:hypothetical protein